MFERLHGNIVTTAQSPRRSDKRNMAVRIAATMTAPANRGQLESGCLHRRQTNLSGVCWIIICSEPLHFGHLKDRRSNPTRSGSIKANDIRVPHSKHDGRANWDGMEFWSYVFKKAIQALQGYSIQLD
jgi:hypothetical protein